MIKKSAPLLGVLSCIFAFYPGKSTAQPSATGCYLPSTNRVYTFNAFGTGYYPQSINTPLSANYCSWTPATGPACTVCSSGVTVNNGVASCNGAAPQILGVGVRNTFTMVACSLDNDTPLLLGAILLLTASRRMRVKASRAKN